jgi:hypothetical protein
MKKIISLYTLLLIPVFSTAQNVSSSLNALSKSLENLSIEIKKQPQKPITPPPLPPRKPTTGEGVAKRAPVTTNQTASVASNVATQVKSPEEQALLRWAANIIGKVNVEIPLSSFDEYDKAVVAFAKANPSAQTAREHYQYLGIFEFLNYIATQLDVELIRLYNLNRDQASTEQLGKAILTLMNNLDQPNTYATPQEAAQALLKKFDPRLTIFDTLTKNSSVASRQQEAVLKIYDDALTKFKKLRDVIEVVATNKTIPAASRKPIGKTSAEQRKILVTEVKKETEEVPRLKKMTVVEQDDWAKKMAAGKFAAAKDLLTAAIDESIIAGEKAKADAITQNEQKEEPGARVEEDEWDVEFTQEYDPTYGTTKPVVQKEGGVVDNLEVGEQGAGV